MSASMKLLLALGIMVGVEVLISLGLVFAVRGHPWLLIVAGLAYGVAFARIGCVTHGSADSP